MHTPSYSWFLVFCFSVGVVKRSSSTLPPVGDAQQSQVAVGGTEALLRRRKRPGSSQHLCVLKQVGKSRIRSNRSVFYCTNDSRSFFHAMGFHGVCLMAIFMQYSIWSHNLVKDESICSHFQTCFKEYWNSLLISWKNQVNVHQTLLSLCMC